MELKPLYQLKVSCVHCEHEFMTSRVRPSFKKAIRTDSDFCAYYKSENPDFYVVRVCPQCGFASTEHSMERLTDAQKQRFSEQVSSRWQPRDYSEERTWEHALETYKLALLCAQIIGEKERIIASLLQHIAWLYRYREEHEQELRFLNFSLESYVRVYELEGAGANNARLLYLIGELNRRIGNFHEAVRWFSRVINDQSIVDAAMIRASREQWAVLREQMQHKQMELPEEMKQGN
ncbi:DUF2225 domain-containing protein [Paenibacillus sp. JX-17]|uniref:DUF2225 domain-containing protein n=1 Tax=Paenibacillus lacisoli TaxID=3064525 RepID=A0ABT9CCV4_9BACL|nr:DUF2225 domain-containing protein [Paenibacillus sp. JX-17]MDO7907095.1 DUF2225 domain-containing protein [Paenibacillus sp. JX-17]